MYENIFRKHNFIILTNAICFYVKLLKWSELGQKVMFMSRYCNLLIVEYLCSNMFRDHFYLFNFTDNS